MEKITAITEVDSDLLKSDALEIVGETKDFKITTPEQFTKSGELLKKIKGKIADFEGLEKECKKPFQDKVKTLTALFKSPLDFLKSAEAKIKDGILDWQDRLDRERQEREAEQKRLQEAEAKKLLAKAAKTKDADKKAELQAQADATMMAAPVAAVETVKVEGLSTVTNWSFELIDQAKLPPEYTMPDEVKIGKVVRATQGTLAIPGVRIYSYKSVKSSKS